MKNDDKHISALYQQMKQFNQQKDHKHNNIKWSKRCDYSNISNVGYLFTNGIVGFACIEKRQPELIKLKLNVLMMMLTMYICKEEYGDQYQMTNSVFLIRIQCNNHILLCLTNG
eukprot:541026_1